jgi:hypothetical protein
MALSGASRRKQIPCSPYLPLIPSVSRQPVTRGRTGGKTNSN